MMIIIPDKSVEAAAASSMSFRVNVVSWCCAASLLLFASLSFSLSLAGCNYHERDLLFSSSSLSATELTSFPSGGGGRKKRKKKGREMLVTIFRLTLTTIVSFWLLWFHSSSLFKRRCTVVAINEIPRNLRNNFRMFPHSLPRGNGSMPAPVFVFWGLPLVRIILEEKGRQGAARE